jgi:hypothetical protein
MMQHYRLIIPVTGVIYATVVFSQRQRWHTQIGDGLAASQAEADQLLELMAYHYLRGADPVKAADFGLHAGNKARERGFYAGAAAYYGQVLTLPNAPLVQRAGAAEGQGDVCLAGILCRPCGLRSNFWMQPEVVGGKLFYPVI